jgi:hypothetical protein
VVTDRRECQLHMFARLIPMPAIHGQHRTLCLAQHEARHVALHRCCGRSLLEEGSRAVSVAHEQMCLGAQDEGSGAPDAPLRLYASRKVRVRHHLFWTGSTHGGAQHRPRRVEGSGAVHR